MHLTTRIAAIAAPAALILTACSSPTVTSSPASQEPSASVSQSEATTAAPLPSQSQTQAQTQSPVGPAARVASQVGCEVNKQNGAAGNGNVAYCTDGERGYTITVYGSQGALDSQFKKLERSVKGTGETITIMYGSNWILRGTESQQVGAKMEKSASAAGGRIVQFTDTTVANP